MFEVYSKGENNNKNMLNFFLGDYDTFFSGFSSHKIYVIPFKQQTKNSTTKILFILF